MFLCLVPSAPDTLIRRTKDSAEFWWATYLVLELVLFVLPIREPNFFLVKQSEMTRNECVLKSPIPPPPDCIFRWISSPSLRGFPGDSACASWSEFPGQRLSSQGSSGAARSFCANSMRGLGMNDRDVNVMLDWPPRQATQPILTHENENLNPGFCPSCYPCESVDPTFEKCIKNESVFASSSEVHHQPDLDNKECNASS